MTRVITIFSYANDVHKIVIIGWTIAGETLRNIYPRQESVGESLLQQIIGWGEQRADGVTFVL